MEVKIIRATPENLTKAYRAIYTLLCETPRVSTAAISRKIGTGPKTTRKRLKEAFDYGYVLNPHIRKRSYANFTQYMYFIDCKDPFESFLQYIEDQNVAYHAMMAGFSNLWVTSLDKMTIESNILMEGPVSDLHVSFAPFRSWDEAKKIMWDKVEKFDPQEYEPRGIIRTHYDEQIAWDEEDEILYQYFKYDLRKPLNPLLKEGISKHKIYNWPKYLPTYCSIITQYYPQTLTAYDPYIFMFETDYEDFIVSLFSEMPTSSLFFKVSGKVILHMYIERELLRRTYEMNLPEIPQFYIPLLMRSLSKKGIIESKAYALINYYWRKNI